MRVAPVPGLHRDQRALKPQRRFAMTMEGVSGKKNGIAQRAKSFGRLLGLGAAMGWIAGCGGGHASQPVTMVSITVTPTNSSIQASATQQFTATGVFRDSSTEGMTKSVSWTSSDASNATIKNSGLSTGVTIGSVTYKAAHTDIHITASPTFYTLDS